MAAVTLQELINHVGVVDKALDERCSDEHINKISQYLPWKLVAPHLLLTETDIDDIDRDGKGENDKRWKALLTWKERQAFKATYKMLIEGLLTTGRATCAESVCSLLKGKPTSCQGCLQPINTPPKIHMNDVTLHYVPPSYVIKCHY